MSDQFTIYHSYKVGKGAVTSPGQQSQRREMLWGHSAETILMQWKKSRVRCVLVQNAVSLVLEVVYKLSWRCVEERGGRWSGQPHCCQQREVLTIVTHQWPRVRYQARLFHMFTPITQHKPELAPMCLQGEFTYMLFHLLHLSIWLGRSILELLRVNRGMYQMLCAYFTSWMV